MNKETQNLIQLNEALNRFVCLRHTNLVIDQATFCHTTELNGAVAGFTAHDVSRGSEDYDEITIECFEVSSMRNPQSEATPCVVVCKRWGQVEWIQPVLCYDFAGERPSFKGAKSVDIALLCQLVADALFNSIGSTCQAIQGLLLDETSGMREGVQIIPEECEEERRALEAFTHDFSQVAEVLRSTVDDLQEHRLHFEGYNYLSVPCITRHEDWAAIAAYLMISGAVDHALYDLCHGELDPSAGGEYNFRRSYVIDALYPEFKIITSDDVIVRESCVTSYGAVGFKNAEQLAHAFAILLETQDMIRSAEDTLTDVATALEKKGFSFDFSIIDDIYMACDVAVRTIATGANNENA